MYAVLIPLRIINNQLHAFGLNRFKRSRFHMVSLSPFRFVRNKLHGPVRPGHFNTVPVNHAVCGILAGQICQPVNDVRGSKRYFKIVGILFRQTGITAPVRMPVSIFPFVNCILSRTFPAVRAGLRLRAGGYRHFRVGNCARRRRHGIRPGNHNLVHLPLKAVRFASDAPERNQKRIYPGIAPLCAHFRFRVVFVIKFRVRIHRFAVRILYSQRNILILPAAEGQFHPFSLRELIIKGIIMPFS